tara:strand:- start:29605 stop:29775 length:171 start_codon:yes stop_codon:yes gene_type:complete
VALAVHAMDVVEVQTKIPSLGIFFAVYPLTNIRILSATAAVLTESMLPTVGLYKTG